VVHDSEQLYYGCASTQSHSGRRAFAVADTGPAAWNSLSDDLRNPTLSTDSCRRLLKTRLFSEYQYIQRVRGITHYPYILDLITYLHKSILNCSLAFAQRHKVSNANRLRQV